MSRKITSDLHIGHKLASEFRKFNSVDEHDEYVLESLLPIYSKTKIWVLGDIAFSVVAVQKVINFFKGRNVSFILGNHDTCGAKPYVDAGIKVIGPGKYKKFFLTHQPMHPQELYRVRGNIHGHIHKDAATKPLTYPYFNVNWDFYRSAIDFEYILQWFAVRE